MSKGLEAITSPVSTELKNGKQFYTYTKEDVEAIEKELKRLEEYDKTIPSLTKKLAQKLKKEKAFDIIKNKPQTEISLIAWGKIKTYEEYLKKVGEWDEGYGDLILTQEEYDLLKEVLL